MRKEGTSAKNDRKLPIILENCCRKLAELLLATVNGGIKVYGTTFVHKARLLNLAETPDQFRQVLANLTSLGAKNTIFRVAVSSAWTFYFASFNFVFNFVGYFEAKFARTMEALR